MSSTPPAQASDQIDAPALSPLVALLRCPACRSKLDLLDVSPGSEPGLGPDGRLACRSCRREYPLSRGTARMLAPGWAESPGSTWAGVKEQTAESFAYEWRHFGRLREEWRKNFLDYVRPHPPEWFRGRLVLDVGAGSGRHSHEAHELGAEVVAVDLGPAIDVARRNLPSDVLTVQADAEDLPLQEGAFDLVMSIGVIHHLPDPAAALRSMLGHVRPDGYLQVYVYWVPEHMSHRVVLRAVSLARTVTTRLPHRLLHFLCYPLAALLFVLVVRPYGYMRTRRSLRVLAQRLPLKTYADYPFSVCVNDQFDRFSAPLERRFTAAEVTTMLRSAGLVDVRVRANHGWLGTGRRPAIPS